MDTKRIKNETKAALVGNRLMLILVFILLSAINVVSLRYYFGIVIIPIFTAGNYLIYKIVFQEKKVIFEKLFYFFKNFNHALKLIGVFLLTNLIVLLGTLLFIVPGFIFAIQYSQALYIMADNPTIGVLDAMNRSKELMNGHKTEYFVFILSFIGHVLLGIITFGIYLIYIMPYIQGSMINYYLHLSYQNEVIEENYNSI